MTKSYSGLERDNSKPRRGSFLNYFWTSSIHAVCFCNCYFNFNLRNPRKAYTVSAPQEEKQSKNLSSCGPAFGRFRSGKTTWKGNSTNTGLYIECFHMTSRRPYWCPKTMKWRPCWCPKPVLWEMNSFLMQMISFVPKQLHRCWPREWKHSIRAGSRWSLPVSLQGFAGYIHYFKSQDMVRRWCLSSLNFGSIKI